ncbi:hypothetical protein FXO38_22461 [Capsicum annuum]|nr:hypothetical protein FXO38_22461 [Capsicum annuum]
MMVALVVIVVALVVFMVVVGGGVSAIGWWCLWWLLVVSVKDYPDEVSHSRILKWLAAKSNIRIKKVGLFKPLDDAITYLLLWFSEPDSTDYPSTANYAIEWVVYPWIMPTEQEFRMTSFITLGLVDTTADPMVELIKKELAGAIAIRKLGVAGGIVDVGGRYADATANYDNEHVDAQEKINMFENTLFTGPSHSYTGYDAADGIVDLDFYKNFKDWYDDLSKLVSNPGGALFDSLVFGFQWDEEIIKYVRGERQNLYGKSWTKAKRILRVMNVDVIHYWVL